LAFLASDAIVRPATTRLDPTTPAVRRLEQVGGAEFTGHMRIQKELAVGAAVVTAGGGDLPAEFVIHAVIRSDTEPVTRDGVARAGSLGWLAWRELFRTTSARLADAALSVPPGAVYYRLDIGGQQVGFASSTIDTAGSAIRVEDVLVLDVPALGVLHRTTAQSRATLSRALRLEDVQATFDGDVGRFSSHGMVLGDTALAIWLVAGGDSEFTRVPLSRPIVLPTLLPLRLAFGGELKPGKTYSVRVFDPLLLAMRDVGVTIAAESTLVVPDSADYDSTAMAWVPVHFDTVRAFRIEQLRDRVRGSAWIDAAGHIVRATSPGAFTMERSAFEIAYENFRRRD